jgi:hypothetical protein
MNVLSAPFLYTMPSQLEAFACFSTFIEHSCPLYVQPTLVGVHRGLKVGLALFRPLTLPVTVARRPLRVVASARHRHRLILSSCHFLQGWLAEPLPAARSVFEDCRLGAVRSSPEQKPLGRALRVPM